MQLQNLQREFEQERRFYEEDEWCNKVPRACK
jgi:hypothetical protein